MDKIIEKRNEKFKRETMGIDRNALICNIEQNMLSLRKITIHNEMMKKRLSNFKKDYSHLELKEIYIDEYEDIDYLENKYEILNNNLQLNKTDNLFKYSLLKIRKLSYDYDGGLETIDIPVELFNTIVIILSNSKDNVLIYECSWILINITCESKFYTHKLIDNKILINLLNLTYSDELGIVSNILWLFSNLCQYEEEACLVTELVNIIERIYEIIKLNDSDILCKALLIIDKLVTNNETFYINKFLNIIPRLQNILLNSNNENVIRSILNTIKNMLETEEVIKFINQEFINYVLTYINDYTYETVNIIGYIVYHSSDEYNDNFVNFSLISTIQNLLENFVLKDNNNNNKILEDIAWCTSNIAACSEKQNKMLFQSKIIIYLLKFSKFYIKPKYFIEVLYIFKNSLKYGSQDVKIKILSDEILEYIEQCLLISTENQNFCNALILCLEFLINILYEIKNNSLFSSYRHRIEKSKILLILEKLEFHNNSIVSDLSNMIVTNLLN